MKLARLIAVLIVGVGSLVGFDAVGGPDAAASFDDSAALYPVTVEPTIQTAKIQASDKEAGDHFGESVAISGDTAIVGARFENSGGDFAGAAYLFERPEGGENNWGEVAKIQASDIEMEDRFGSGVAISGDTAIVGAFGADTNGLTAGAAYLFKRNQGGANDWGQVAEVLASDKQRHDRFGISVAISGDTAIVGAAGSSVLGSFTQAAYLFERNEGGGDNWGQVAKIQASNKEAGDAFGTSVAISGDTAIVGAPFEDTGGSDAGAAYLFERNEGGANNWGQVVEILASDKQAGDRFGFSVAISGDTAIVGAQLEGTGGLNAGAAYLFERNEGGANNWGQVAEILASDKQAGDRFGFSVAISGDTAIVGAQLEGTGGLNAGAGYVFEAVTTAAAFEMRPRREPPSGSDSRSAWRTGLGRAWLGVGVVVRAVAARAIALESVRDYGVMGHEPTNCSLEVRCSVP